MDRFFGVMERMSWPLATLAWAGALVGLVFAGIAFFKLMLFLMEDAPPFLFLVVLALMFGALLATVIRE